MEGEAREKRKAKEEVKGILRYASQNIKSKSSGKWSGVEEIRRWRERY